MMPQYYRKSGFPGGSDSKESAYNAGELDSIPGLGRLPGEGNGYPLQYSCLENPMDTGTWWATVHGVTESQTQLRATLLYILDINLFQLNILNYFLVCQLYFLYLLSYIQFLGNKKT